MALAINCFILFAIFEALFIVTDARRGHLEPLGNSGSIKLLHERFGFVSPPEFLKEYVLKNRPVLMRGAIRDSPAVTKWTDKYLSEIASSNSEVNITIEYGKKETRLNGTFIAFSKYLKMYNESDVYMVNAMPYYLESDMIIPWSIQCEDYKRSFEDNVMWFSSGGTKSVIHNDGYENFNCLIRGKKRFLFVNTTKYKDVLDQIIDYKNGTYGSVDVEKVDLDKYPVYEGMEFLKAEMNPGDCIYSPVLWIHQVESWGSNIAVNVWWYKEINSLINSSLCTKSYNRSMTFASTSFHRTTFMGDPEQIEDAIFALQHGIARIVFITIGRSQVSPKEFVRAMTNNTRQIPKDHREILMSLFYGLDQNRDRRLDVEEVTEELSPNSGETLHDHGTLWTSVARMHKYPLPVDFSNDLFRSAKPFTMKEISPNAQSNNKGKPKHPKRNKSTRKDESEPSVIEKDNIGEHDEL